MRLPFRGPRSVDDAEGQGAGSAQAPTQAQATVPLAGALTLLCLVGTTLVSGVPGFPVRLVVVLGVAALLRILWGRQGQPLLGRRALRGLAAVLCVLGVLLLLDRTGQRGGPLLVFLGMTTALQGLLLLGSLRGPGTVVLLSLSSVQALGSAFLRKDFLAVALLVLFVIVAAWALMLLERQAALLAKRGRVRGERRLRVLRDPPLPPSLAWRTLSRLTLIGLPAGLLVFLVTPRLDVDARGPAFSQDAEFEESDALREASGRGTAPTRNRVRLPSRFFSTPIGVEAIKNRDTPVLEVVDRDSVEAPEAVYLRDNALDNYDPERVVDGTNHIWMGSPHLAEESWAAIEPGMDGWFALSPTPKPEPRARRTLRARILAGGFTRLYLQPWVIRARVLRPSAGRLRPVLDIGLLKTRLDAIQVVPRDHLTRAPNAMGTAPLLPGDVIEFDSVPQSRDDSELRGQRSDASVSPDPAYLQIPASARAALTRIALARVGGELDPWLRAKRLVNWLRSGAFTYRLESKPLDPRRPVLDFLTRSREGSCSHFAQSLTLLLRAMGHPARYTRGMWGGDLQESRGSRVFRLQHYHAYTELWLEEYGWVALNPTPPDREAVDAGSREYEDDAGALDAGEDVPAPDEEGTGANEAEGEDNRTGGFLEFGREEQRAFLRSVKETLGDAFEPVATTVTNPKHQPWIFATILALIGVIAWRRRSALALRAVVGEGGRVPEGPYGEALVWLSARGYVRKRSVTPEEFRRRLSRLVPEVEGPLEALTRVFEATRYGTSPQTRTPEGEEALRALRALKVPHIEKTRGHRAT